MRRLSCLLALILLCGLVTPVFAASLQVGEPAPAFRLQDQNSHWRSPADFHGHWLVMYFYLKDFTAGCTTGVCTFRDDIARLRQAGAEVMGVSLDDVKSHAKLAARYHVPFPLLADNHRKVVTAYGVLTAAAGIHYAKRTTSLIDPQGRIAKVYVDVDPQKNAAQVLGDLATLKAAP